MNREAIAFGKAVRHYRKKIGINQEELAFSAHLDRTFISALERGVKQPTLSTIFAIAKALKISPCDLVRYVEETY